MFNSSNSAFNLYGQPSSSSSSTNRRSTTHNTPQPDFDLSFVDNVSASRNDHVGTVQPNILADLGLDDASTAQQSRSTRTNNQSLDNALTTNYDNAHIESNDLWLYDLPNTTTQAPIQSPVPTYPMNLRSNSQQNVPQNPMVHHGQGQGHGRFLRSRRSSLLAGLPGASLEADDGSNQFMAFASESSQQKQNLLRTNRQMRQNGYVRSPNIYSTRRVPLEFNSPHSGGVASAPPQLSPDDTNNQFRSAIPTPEDGHMLAGVGVRSDSRNGLDGLPDNRSGSYSHAIPMKQVKESSLYMESSSEIERDDPVTLRRKKYKAKSSIPTDLSSANYAEQCAKAAVSSRLPPYSLHADEYNILRSYLPYIHVTTYLNIRNGILRLWLSNPIVNVTAAEAAGCAREERYYGLAEVAYAFLVRYGYINFGCVEYTTRKYTFVFQPGEHKKPRMTIAVIGAGIAGLGCARQLENLFRRNSSHFSEYENIPRVLVLEGRRRIGGRVYSASLRSAPNSAVDVGGQLIMGFGNGNPLAVLVRRQLGLPVDPIDTNVPLFDEKTGQEFSKEAQERGAALFRHILQRVSEFKNSMQEPSTVYGDKTLMKAAKDPKIIGGGGPRGEEHLSIAQLEESEELPKAYEDPGEMEEQYDDKKEAKEETKFLKMIGCKLKENKKSAIHVAPEPQGEMNFGLGQTIKGVVEQLSKIAELSDADLRILNWHYANLEFAVGSNLDNVSLSNWDTSEGYEFTGKDSMIRNGFMGVTQGLYVYPEKLDVRFKASVKVIEYDEGAGQSQLILENGDRIHCDRVVVTVPLGVLKDRAIQCIPDLPQWKADSIERLGYGVTNKVVLVYDKVFWDDSKDLLCVCKNTTYGSSQEDDAEIRGNCFLFWNCTKQTGQPVVVGIISGEAALQVANESDEKVVEHARQTFEKSVPRSTDKGFTLTESVVTRWQMDPFSRGSYSYVGREATAVDYDLLARPVNNALFFAGEATCRHFPGTVHGAYLSALRSASEVLSSLIGDIEIPHPLIPPKGGTNQYHSGTSTKERNTPTPSGQIVSGIKRPSSQSSRMPLSQPSSSHDVGPSSGSGYFEHIPGTSDLYREVGSQRGSANPPSAIDEKIKEWKARLKDLREERTARDNEKMRRDMINELGERPVKPERSGANPFLIFQKDFWDKCREQTDLAKQQSTKDPSSRATRNEVRSALGKMWREFPEKDKAPYLKETETIKEENLKKADSFKKRVRQYDSEAEGFRRRWKEEHESEPSEEELQLIQLLQGAGASLDEDKHKSKRKRL